MIGVKNIYGYNAGFKDVERTAEKPELRHLFVFMIGSFSSVETGLKAEKN